jgi:gamma-glutamyl hercynylcysteine S-oxide hydrolase
LSARQTITTCLYFNGKTMCRLAAYLGPPVLLKRFLIDPPHNLIKQAWAPLEMEEAVLNADGYGLGWYPDNSNPVTYLDTQPIWADVNLEGLSVSLSSHLWMANVRSATPGQQTGVANTQPFASGRILFMHNGFIENFNPEARMRFHQQLRPEIQAGIGGNTDSEYLFALFRQNCDRSNNDPAGALLKALDEFDTICPTGTAYLNIILSDGEKLYAVRHAVNGHCPTLYYTRNDSIYPGATVLASERLTTESGWQAVPEHCLIVLSSREKPLVRAL